MGHLFLSLGSIGLKLLTARINKSCYKGGNVTEYLLVTISMNMVLVLDNINMEEHWMQISCHYLPLSRTHTRTKLA